MTADCRVLDPQTTLLASGARPAVLGPRDLESSPEMPYDDPLSFSKSRKSEDELSELRKRSRKGRRIAEYQKRQNEVRRRRKGQAAC